MVRLVGLGRWGHRARPVAAGPMYSMRVALGLCLIACLTGTDSSQSSAQQQDREGQTVDTAEMAGMHELFDDLDADNDQNFEQQELRGMMAQLGLDSKNTRAWKWKDALRKMDGDNNELLSVPSDTHAVGTHVVIVRIWFTARDEDDEEVTCCG